MNDNAKSMSVKIEKFVTEENIDMFDDMIQDMIPKVFRGLASDGRIVQIEVQYELISAIEGVFRFTVSDMKGNQISETEFDEYDTMDFINKDEDVDHLYNEDDMTYIDRLSDSAATLVFEAL